VVWEHEADDETALELRQDLSEGLHHLDLEDRPFDPIVSGWPGYRYRFSCCLTFSSLPLGSKFGGAVWPA